MQGDIIVEEKGPICWQEAGAGAPILFLHAMAGSRTAWVPQFEYFAPHYRCIAWDMPGFGLSAALPDGAQMAEVTNSLKGFVTQTLGLTSAHFVGLSVGGMILQHFAAEEPELVRSLTIMDSSPKFGLGGDMSPEDFMQPILSDLADGTSVRAFSDTMIKAITGPSCSPQVIDAAIGAMARAQLSGLVLTTQLIGNHDAMSALGHIRAPTLVMVGADDADTPVSYAEEIAKTIKGAQLEIIPDAGHLSNLENPEAVNAVLANFLAAQAGGVC